MADTLKDELANDPLGRGYAGMSDQGATDDLNTSYRTRDRTSMTGDEIAQQADTAEQAGLDNGAVNNTADVLSHWLALCARTTVDPFATANVQLVISIFGNPSVTRTNLIAARVESITRAVELGLNIVKVGHVAVARA